MNLDKEHSFREPGGAFATPHRARMPVTGVHPENCRSAGRQVQCSGGSCLSGGRWITFHKWLTSNQKLPGDSAQAVESLPSMFEALGSITSTI